MNTTLRWTALVGGALLLAALAVVFFMRAPEPPTERADPHDAPTAAQKEPTPVDAAAETGSTTESGEHGSNAEREKTVESFRFSADRWIEIMRNQTLPNRRNREEFVQYLERMRETLEKMPIEERDAYVNSYYYVWEWRPHLSYRENMARKAVFEAHGTYDPINETPRSVIEFLVEGLDDLTAARRLAEPPEDWGWKRESGYALEYVNRALEKDPTSREALLLKHSLARSAESASQLIEHHPNDEEALIAATLTFSYNFPEDTVYALVPYLDRTKGAAHGVLHNNLGVSYERMGMYAEALEQYQFAKEAGFFPLGGNTIRIERGKPLPFIWETRAAAEAAKQSLLADPAPQSEAHETPPNLEAEMSAAYADFAKAYQSAFEMEYALSEATPEGYMNALLSMARAFARAGDAKHAQDAYNAARKRYSVEEIKQAFRRLDEQERLRRQASNEEDDSGE